jgi:hypothetical protein
MHSIHLPELWYTYKNAVDNLLVQQLSKEEETILRKKFLTFQQQKNSFHSMNPSQKHSFMKSLELHGKRLSLHYESFVQHQKQKQQLLSKQSTFHFFTVLNDLDKLKDCILYVSNDSKTVLSFYTILPNMEEQLHSIQSFLDQKSYLSDEHLKTLHKLPFPIYHPHIDHIMDQLILTVQTSLDKIHHISISMAELQSYCAINPSIQSFYTSSLHELSLLKDIVRETYPSIYMMRGNRDIKEKETYLSDLQMIIQTLEYNTNECMQSIIPQIQSFLSNT